MTECQSELPFDFYQVRPLSVQFSGLDLSSDAGLLLVRQAEERLGIRRGLAGCIEEWRDPEKVVHPLTDLVSQRVYQLVGGYEDAKGVRETRRGKCQLLKKPENGNVLIRKILTNQNRNIAMTLKYPEAIELASQLISSALLQDIEAVLATGLELDKLVQTLVRAIGHTSLEQVYAGVNEHLSAEYQSSPDWQLERRPVVEFKTLFGPVAVESPYWSATTGAGGMRPMKTVMGVEGNRYSEAVERALSDFGIEKSFERAAQQFKEHYGWSVDRGTVMRHTQTVAGTAQQYLEERLASSDKGQPSTSEQTSSPSETYVVELDGCDIRTAVLRRAEQTDSSNGDSDGWVRVVSWQEVRTGLVRPLSEQRKLYVCLSASYDEIAQQLAALAHERGQRGTSQTIGVGDGGIGLAEALARTFSPFHYILDLGHLKTHFYETAEALGIDPKLRHAWVSTYIDKLGENQVEGVLEDLTELYEKTDNERLRRLIKHLNRFRDAVDYGRFKENHWPIGSGEVESAHRYIPAKSHPLRALGHFW